MGGYTRAMSTLDAAPVRSASTRRAQRRSFVTREPESVIWFRRVVLRRKPVLYHFEVQLTDHCNLSCKGCPSFSSLRPPAFADLAEFESDMQHMANIFSKVKQIHLLGGEPLLHPEVGEFCRAARRIFPKTRIYLRTNGTMVMRMNEEFWSTLSANKIILLCDPYPVGLPIIEIKFQGKAHHVKVEWTDLRQELFKVPIDPKGGHHAPSSFSKCQGHNNRPLLRDGRLYPCAFIACADVFRESFGVSGLEVYAIDWIGIRDEPDAEQVFAFLRKPVHWCSNCDMDNSEFYEWGPSSHHISEWTCIPPPG